MKQNTKFIWIYVAILFSFALILILFAGLTQNNYQKDITDQQIETAGVRQSLSSVTKQYEDSKKENEELKAQIEKLTSDNSLLTAELQASILGYGGDETVTRTLVKAYLEKQSSGTDSAKALVAEIDKKSLTEAQKQIYEMIIGE